MASSNNDINIIHQSHIFSNIVNGTVPLIEFKANEQLYNMGYYLVDGIYPKWPMFVSIPPHTTDLKVTRIKEMQESCARMSKEHSEFSKCYGQLSEDLYDFDTTIICAINVDLHYHA